MTFGLQLTKRLIEPLVGRDVLWDTRAEDSRYAGGVQDLLVRRADHGLGCSPTSLCVRIAV